MTLAESAFLERAVVQMLFVSGREFSLECLREKLHELFVQESDGTVRAAASVGGFELLQVLLKTTQKLEKLGLRLDIRAGSVRITTAEGQEGVLAQATFLPGGARQRIEIGDDLRLWQGVGGVFHRKTRFQSGSTSGNLNLQ